jgi:hypothetical protein
MAHANRSLGDSPEWIAANRTGNPACRLAGLGGYKHFMAFVLWGQNKR